MTLNRRTLVGTALFAGAATSASAQDAALEPLARPASGNIRVAFLIDHFHNIIDLAGPWEAMVNAGSHEQHFELFTVSPIDEELSLGGVKARADYSLAAAPQPHVVIMGAQSSREGSDSFQAKIDWLRQVAPRADIVMSVCTGAYLLAGSGLIDGRTATTHHDYYQDFETTFPNVRLVRDRRFVDNGKFISAGGLTSGIDAALHVVARYYGAGEAQTIATYMEHSSDGWRTGVRTPA